MRATCISVVTFVFVLIAAASDAASQPVGAYPEQLVTPEGGRVINGCGPGSVVVNNDKRFLDVHSYKFGVDRGEYVTYTVNFRDSCNLHDVGYQGTYFVASNGQWVKNPLVYDKIRNEYVDYANATRAWVDERFLVDMQTQCEQQMRQQTPMTTMNRPAPKSSQDRAIALCKGDEAGTYVGAEAMYWGVRKIGRSFYTEGPSAQRVRGD